jgi:hypothetical protein
MARSTHPAASGGLSEVEPQSYAEPTATAPLDLCGSVLLQAGERLVSVSTGGGGTRRLMNASPSVWRTTFEDGSRRPAPQRLPGGRQAGLIDEVATRALRSIVPRIRPTDGNYSVEVYNLYYRYPDDGSTVAPKAIWAHG